MPRLRPRVEIKRLGEDTYKVYATYGTRVFSDSLMNADTAREWLWKQITSFWGSSMDVDYSEEMEKGAPPI